MLRSSAGACRRCGCTGIRFRGPSGEDAYLDQRRDFLMLLPGLRRVALEVDGQQHYATPAGKPSPRRRNPAVDATLS